MSGPPSVELADGRQLAYEEYGRADGHPLLCFHGIPGSRLMWTLFDEPAQRRDVHLVAPDRPGFGASDFQPDRRLTDWPDDVAHLADDCGFDAFAVLGFSAGAPHALACAAAMSDRVQSVVLVSAVGPNMDEHGGPYERGIARAGESIPGLTRGLFGAAGWLARNWRARFRAALETHASDPDRELFRRPEGDVLVEDAVEGVRRGGRGAAHEFRMIADPWELAFDAVEQPVILRHGRQDRTVDERVAEELRDRLPRAELVRVDGGHYSTLVDDPAGVLGAATEPGL